VLEQKILSHFDSSSDKYVEEHPKVGFNLFMLYIRSYAHVEKLVPQLLWRFTNSYNYAAAGKKPDQFKCRVVLIFFTIAYRAVSLHVEEFSIVRCGIFF
jgi:hypothetical protein